MKLCQLIYFEGKCLFKNRTARCLCLVLMHNFVAVFKFAYKWVHLVY